MTVLAVFLLVGAAVILLRPLVLPESSAAAPPGSPKADGVVRGIVTLHEDTPAITRLDPALVAALREAGTDAERDGVELQVTSGWRSRAYQQRLLDDAVSRYGSEEEAARWVATPDTSPHVTGDAVDIGPTDAMSWLSQHGSAYGLCQIYANEMWHYELRRQALSDGCPTMFSDPTQDPRMR